GMNRLHADAAVLVVFVFADAYAGEVQLAFDLPAAEEALNQVADARFGDGVAAGLLAARVGRVHRNEADHGEHSARPHAHLAVVLAGDVAHLLARDGLGLQPAQ